MDTITKLAKTLLKKARQREGTLIPAILGDTNGNVRISGRMVYVRLYNGEVLEVLNQRVANVPNRPVLLGYDRSNPNTLQVIASREVYADETIIDIGAHHELHEWDGPDTTWIAGQQFLPMLVMPSAQGGLTVQVYGGLLLGGTWVDANNSILDLSSHQPAVGARYVLVQADLSTGELNIKDGEVVASKEALANSDIPFPDDGYFPMGIVRLYDGQDQLFYTKSTNDFKDPRWAGFSTSGGAGYDLAAAIHAAEASAIDDSDEMGFWENAANALRKITWANIKATLKGFFDGLYAPIDHTHSLSGQYRQFAWSSDGAGGWEFISAGGEPVLHLQDLE